MANIPDFFSVIEATQKALTMSITAYNTAHVVYYACEVTRSACAKAHSRAETLEQLIYKSMTETEADSSGVYDAVKSSLVAWNESEAAYAAAYKSLLPGRCSDQ